MANIKVAVRVRPISVRESKLTGSQVVVRAEPNEISLTNLKVSSSKAGDSRERTRRYGFDYCFDSSDPEAKNYATQATIYQSLGQSILDAMFAGYNSCLVAYGQSASGKTYTMMGTKEDPGLIPRLCEGLFSRVEQEDGRERIYHVTISYLEIYNEKVRDLLKPSATASGLRVREHPRLGPYVQGLTHHVVRTLGSLMSYVEEGTKARKTASTLQNPSSSRSHALLTVGLSQEAANGERTLGVCRRQDAAPRGGSKLHLVDLAGSESAATCGGVHRLKEGMNINKSLVALGNVISALAERGSTGSGPGRRYIPYRDSSLTWLLKDALGGNATTIMLATISPASGSYNETAHTLRFAQRAQSVVNRPVVNEDPVARLIRELRDEVARLKSLLLEKLRCTSEALTGHI
ncbi:PREDICTED: kinesin-like protein KIF16B [Dinoponera quadriceps]|uniref:Kinesin-like protein n=1 Tax=Dinoponera quadriceps TaxID=609295 RepID=A0A6P3XB20_DINQU|nr:PREDICTED: kinesin-like protein KIF16B [Dinoponera quadriceps]